MRLRALLILLALAWSNCSNAATPDKPFVVFGYYDVSCGKWAGERKTNPQFLDWYYVYFQGFATAHNAFSNDSIAGPLPDALSFGLYVDKYCNEKPLGNFLGAVFQLTDELATKAATTSPKKK